MKQIVSAIGALLLIAALLCGCAVTPTPSESMTDTTTTATATVTTATTVVITAVMTEVTTIATTEATTTRTEETTTIATTTTVATTITPTTAPVTRPTFDPSIPVAAWPAQDENHPIKHDGSAYFTFEDFEYKVNSNGKLEIRKYIGSATDVTIPYEVQYVWKETLCTNTVDIVPVDVFMSTDIQTLRWHPDVPYTMSMQMRFKGLTLPSHIYLPKDNFWSAEEFLKDNGVMSEKNVFWYNLIGTPSDCALTEPLHLYLIKGAPLTEMLYDERAYFPYGWELDFSEEGTYCFYTQKDGKDDQPVYFHVAESFE